MKKIQMIVYAIISCFMFSGCIAEIIGASVQIANESKKEKLARAQLGAVINGANAKMACYQFSGASEAKFKVKYNIDDSKELRALSNNIEVSNNRFIYSKDAQYLSRISIAEAKASKNGSQNAINECLKSFNAIVDKENKCEADDTDCYEEVGKAYIAHTQSMQSKLKNVKFTCSQTDEILEKYGPKFDKDIEQYALDLIKWKPIVSKDIIDDTLKDTLTKELKKNKIDDDIIKTTLDDFESNSECAYKMQYYVGNLEDLDGFKRAGVLASDIASQYNDFINTIKHYFYKSLPNTIIIMPTKDVLSSVELIEKALIERNNDINKAIKDKQSSKSIATLIASKCYAEAALKFLKED